MFAQRRMYYTAPSRALRELPGMRILITGAARGIGAASAKRLQGRGAKVVLAGIEPDLLAQVAAECGDSLAVPCDVRDRRQVRPPSTPRWAASADSTW